MTTGANPIPARSPAAGLPDARVRETTQTLPQGKQTIPDGAQAPSWDRRAEGLSAKPPSTASTHSHHAGPRGAQRHREIRYPDISHRALPAS